LFKNFVSALDLSLLDCPVLCLARKAHSGMSLKKEENIKQTKLIRKHGAGGVLTQKRRSSIKKTR
jgi:hypothetical protein